MSYPFFRAVKYVTVRIYGPLNDFLPVNRRQVGWSFAIETPTSVKDLVEGLGVPRVPGSRPSLE